MLKPLFTKIFLLICSIPAAFPSQLVSIRPVDHNLIMLHYDDGYVRYHGYHETGENDTVYQQPLDLESASRVVSYQVWQQGKGGKKQAVHPVRVGRKSKPTDFAFKMENGKWPVVMEHWVYLELPFSLQENGNYTLKVSSDDGEPEEHSFRFRAQETFSPSIHINQLGFTPESDCKYAYISHWMGDLGGFENDSLEGRPFYILRTSDLTPVFRGTVARKSDFQTALPDVPVDQSIRGSLSGADIWECNFSPLRQAGEYKVVVEGMGCSYPFEIDPDIYRDAFYYTCRGLYHHRSGIERTAEFTAWTRPADHHPKLTPEYPGAAGKHKVYLTSIRNIDLTDESGHNQKDHILQNIIDTLDNCWGFYHDAGDWDGYPSHIRVPRELMMAYELAPDNFTDGELNIPESGNGLPDILDEAVWLVNYFKRNIGKTGGIFGGRNHTEFNKGFPAIGMGIPSYEDPGFSIVTGEDPMLSYEFASVALQYAWCLRLSDKSGTPAVKALTDDYENAAFAAYQWAQNNTRPGDSAKVRMAKAHADVWRYKLSGNTAFQNEFKKAVADRLFNPAAINEYNGAFALYAYALLPQNFTGIDTAFHSRVRQWVINYARYRVTDAIAANRSFRSGGNSKFDSKQGSATIPAAMPALVAWIITGDRIFYQAAQTSSDYALGGNPLNIVWVTGLGDNPPGQIMNLDSYYDAIEAPIPGVSPYGPSHRCDWMGKRTDGCKGEGPWDNDFALDQVYPASDLWPIHECWFENRYCPPSGEYTVHQTISPAAAVYGVLCQPGGRRKPASPGASIGDFKK